MTLEQLSSIEKLLESFHQLYQSLRLNMRTQWKRDLPLEELLFDRWERARSLGFGKNTSIYHNSYVYGTVSVGANTWIGPYTLLDGTGGLTIGDYCNISAGVQIYTHDSARWVLSGGKSKYEYAPVKIGNNCYIGPQTVIAKGVTIGDHCLIGSCSFVNSDIPSFSLAFGIPCRPRGTVRVSENGEVSWHLFEAGQS